MPDPAIVVVATTYAPNDERGEIRREENVSAFRTWEDNLRYTGELLLHIADDGSRLPGWPPGRESHHNPIPSWGGMSYSEQWRRGVGASLNAGMGQAFRGGMLAAYFVDDWLCTESYDLTPWARLLERRDDIACVRLGPPHPGVSGTVEHENGLWWLRLDRHHYAMAQRPALYHARTFAAYGLWPEGESALECERLYNERYCRRPFGPEVVLALPTPWLPQLGLKPSFSPLRPDGLTP